MLPWITILSLVLALVTEGMARAATNPDLKAIAARALPFVYPVAAVLLGIAAFRCLSAHWNRRMHHSTAVRWLGVAMLLADLAALS